MSIIAGLDKSDAQLPVIPVYVDAAGHVQVDVLTAPALAGTTNVAVVKQGTASLGVRFSNPNLPAGASTQTVYTCPVGSVVNITHIAYHYVAGGAISGLTFWVDVAGAIVAVTQVVPAASGVWYPLPYSLWLDPGWILKCNVIAATLNDDLNVAIHGKIYNV